MYSISKTGGKYIEQNNYLFHNLTGMSYIELVEMQLNLE